MNECRWCFKSSPNTKQDGYCSDECRENLRKPHERNVIPSLTAELKTGAAVLSLIEHGRRAEMASINSAIARIEGRS